MVRDPAIRKRKYEAGVDPEKIRRNLEALKPGMVELEGPYLAQISEVERKVKRICEAQGVPTYLVAQYVNVGRVCYSLSKRFSGASRDEEAQRVVDHWISRGLDPGLTVRSCNLTGCITTAAPAPPAAPDILPIFYEPLIGSYADMPEGMYINPIVMSMDFPFAVYTPRRLLVSPFPLCRKMRFDQIGFYTGGVPQAGAEAVLGVYDSNGYGYPNNLLFESGYLDASAADSTISAPLDLTLEKGLYFTAFWVGFKSPLFPILTHYLTLMGSYDAGSMLSAFQRVLADVPLPNPFPANATMIEQGAVVCLRLVELL